MLATPQNHPICAEGQRRRVKGAADLFLPLHLGRQRWQVDVEERHESGHGEQQGGSPDREGGSSMEGTPRLVVEIRPRARSMRLGSGRTTEGKGAGQSGRERLGLITQWSGIRTEPGDRGGG
jgi:hypothetical protein